MAIDVGDVYRLNFKNTSPGGGLVNADTVTLTIQLPDGTQVVQTPVAPTSTGVYQYDFLTTQPGRHVAQWVGAGSNANAGANSEIFDVRTLNPLYLVSLAEMKEQLKITSTTDDETIRRYIESATNAVERIRGEVAVKRTFTEEHRFPEWYRGIGVVNPAMNTGTFPRQGMALQNFPVVSLQSVARVDGTMTWDTTLLHVEQASGVVSVMFGPIFVGQISVTYTAGYQVIPSEFTLAASIIVEHLWQTRRPGRSGPAMPGIETTMVPGIGYAVPNQAVELLGMGIPGIG